ncbi:putative reverse transcriptase domain-containing protein [Tanacetum coccineum]
MDVYRSVIVISTISISLDSSEESVGTPSGRVFWLGRIPTTVPVTTPTIDPPVIHDDTSLISTETPTISPITSTIPPTAPTTHYTSPFIHTNSSDDDTLDTPPSPTHEIPPVEPIPYGPVHMMTARKRVGPLPTHRLVVRYLVEYSSSDYFTFDYSSRDSPLDSSSEMPSDSSSDALSDSSSVPSIPHSPAAITERPSHSSSAGPSRKRSRSPTTSVPVSSHVPGAPSYVRANLLPPRKRIRSPDFVTNLEDCSDESYESSVPRETSLRDDIVIDECIAYADALRAEGIDARVVVETAARDEVETSARGMVEVKFDRITHLVVLDDVLKASQEEGAVEVTYEALGDMSKRISELKRDNTRLIDMLDVVIQRVTRIQRKEMRVQREIRQIRRLRFYDRVRIEASKARDAARNLKPLAEGGDGQGGKNGDDYEGGDGGGDGNGNRNEGGNDNGNGNKDGKGNEGGNGYENHNVNFGGFKAVARECTYQDFLNALTWWNTHKRKIGIEAAYAMTWTKLINLMTEGNVIDAEPIRLQEAIRIANNLMYQKLKGYARSAENKRRSYTAGNNEKKGYVGSLPYCNKCKLHHGGPCTMRCGNYKRVGHMARDCTAVVALNTQRALVRNQSGITGNNEATAKVYAIGGGGANPDSNVITGTFLLNNCYASMLFDSGTDRSFVSYTFSALLDVTPSTLDTTYDIEFADGRISKTNIILRGCTLGLLCHPFDIDLMPIELGHFDVIIGMHWLEKYHAVIVYDEKIVSLLEMRC